MDDPQQGQGSQLLTPLQAVAHARTGAVHHVSAIVKGGGAVHFGRKGFTKTAEARERAALNRILRRHTGTALTDEEYKSFNA